MLKKIKKNQQINAFDIIVDYYELEADEKGCHEFEDPWKCQQFPTTEAYSLEQVQNLLIYVGKRFGIKIV